MRFYKSKILVQNAITVQTEDNLGKEADKFKNLIQRELKIERNKLLMNLEDIEDISLPNKQAEEGKVTETDKEIKNEKSK